jgi:hypothetical protein
VRRGDLKHLLVQQVQPLVDLLLPPQRLHPRHHRQQHPIPQLEKRGQQHDRFLHCLHGPDRLWHGCVRVHTLTCVTAVLLPLRNPPDSGCTLVCLTALHPESQRSLSAYASAFAS